MGPGKLSVAVVAILLSLGTHHIAGQNCDVFEYSPFGQENKQGACSGLGVCLDGVNCECDPGFTGLSDIINTDGIDCHVNINLLKGFWALNLLLATGTFVYSAPRIVERCRIHMQLKKTRREAGRKLTWRNNRALAANLVGSVGCTVSMTLFAILQLARDDERIGVTFGATLFFAMSRTCFYGAVWLYQPALLRSSLTGKRNVRWIVEFNEKASLVSCGFAALISFAPFLCFFEEDGTGPVHVAAYYILMIGTLVQLVFFGAQALYVKQNVRKVLLESYSVAPSATTLELIAAISAIQMETFRQCVAQFCIYAGFTFSGRLLNSHVYFLPFGWLAYVVIAKKLTFTHIRITGSSSSSKRGGTTVGSVANSSSKYNNAESSVLMSSSYGSSVVVESKPKAFKEGQFKEKKLVDKSSKTKAKPSNEESQYKEKISRVETNSSSGSVSSTKEKRYQKQRYKPTRSPSVDSLDV